MTGHNCIKLNFSWKDIESKKYLEALSLPTLPWVSPFLSRLGLPNALLEQPSVWESIYTQALVEFETRYRTRNWTGSPDGERGQLIRQIVTKALRQLAVEMGQDVALDLEQWVRFHFFCPEATRAMSEWKWTLWDAYLSPEDRRGDRKVPPPAALMPLLPEIAELMDYERRREIEDALMNAAPAPPSEQIPYEKLEKCYEATLLSRALEQAMTLKALQTIASRLNDTERKEVVRWAEVQSQAMRRTALPENLCGDKYLQPKLPCTNVPSVLELS